MDDCTFAACSNQKDLVQNLDESIRATLIVSDNLGYELIREMTTKGISFNKTICNVIIVNGGGNTDGLKELIEAQKAITVKVVENIDELPEVAKSEYTRAKHE